MNESGERTTVSDATRAVDRLDEWAPHQPDGMPTREEDENAPADVPDSVRNAHREMDEKGAQAEGEPAAL